MNVLGGGRVGRLKVLLEMTSVENQEAEAQNVDVKGFLFLDA